MMLTFFSKYSSHFKNLIWYLGSTLAVALINISINPLIALNIPPEDYAIIGYYSSFNILFTPFITFYLSNYFIKKFFQVKEKDREKLKSTILYMLLFFSLGLTFITLASLYIYQVFINNESEIAFFPYALLTVFSIQFTGIYSLTLAEFRIKRMPKKFALFSIINGVLLAIMALLLVVLIKGGAVGKLSAILVTNLIMFIVVLVFQKNSFRAGFDKYIFKDTISFCWPLVIASCIGFASNGFDKIALERLNNLVELGYYSVGAQIAGYLSICSTAINATFQPDIYENYAKKNYKRVALFVGISVGSISVVVILFILFAPFLVDILTAGRYIFSTKYSVIIALASITSAIYYASSQVTMAMGLTKLLLGAKVIGGALSILLYLFLIDKWTYVGAAWGNVLSFLIFFLINLTFVYCYSRNKKRKKNATTTNN